MALASPSICQGVDILNISLIPTTLYGLMMHNTVSLLVECIDIHLLDHIVEPHIYETNYGMERLVVSPIPKKGVTIIRNSPRILCIK